MLEPTTPEYHYASYMVRIWRRVDETVNGLAGRWMGEMEHLQSGQHWHFEALEEVPELMRRSAEDPQLG